MSRLGPIDAASLERNAQPPALMSSSTPAVIKISQPFDKVTISCLDHKGLTGPGAAYGSITWRKIDLFTEPLLRHGVGPIVAWGDFAMKYYGLIHILIDDSQLDTASNALLDAGHTDTIDDINKSSNWKEIGDRFFKFSTFPVLHGLSIPPLKSLAESFIVTLSEDVIQLSEVIDERMVSNYWRIGRLIK
ncbi:hypothetical protein Clacol_004701 [Clathrus columnatus]|uniref:Uncharacterized protein n=1 Tax=Clathrus columnatus TaxID=1419009 RepID=A0AAV5AC31_9AGAM|nr:hypothetical protein Clacol_004701 [Clathrus columnatus]